MKNIVFGLTGGIAVGKSKISKVFKSIGFPVVDADLISRQVVITGSKGLSQIINVFGKDFLNKDGFLDRIKLGNLVFSDRYSLNKINEIMMPLIKEESFKQINFLKKNYPVIAYDASLIIEWRNHNLYRPLVVVHCSSEEQLHRLMSRNNLTKEQAMARINSQMSAQDKIKYADFEISTSGTVEESASKARQIALNIINMSRNNLNKSIRRL